MTAFTSRPQSGLGRITLGVLFLGFAALSTGCARAALPEAQVAASEAMPAPGGPALPPGASDAAGVAQAKPAEAMAVSMPGKPADIPPAVRPGAPAKAKTDGPKLDDAQKPLLIYEGALGLAVKKAGFATAIERAIDVAEAAGGYLVSRTDSGVQLRVPSGEFRGTLKALEELGAVTRRSVSAQDVSEEFHDLGVRLKSLESVRDRLEQFLTRAVNVDEALRVGKELEAVVRQIDEVKGHMQFLKTRAAYSLINVSLEAKAEAVAIVKAQPPSPPAPRPLRMPVGWLRSVGLDKLLALD